MLYYPLRRRLLIATRLLRTTRMIPSRSVEDGANVPSRCAPSTLDEVPPAILYLSDDFVMINKPCDVRMDGEFPVTVEKLVHRWIADRTGKQTETRLIHQLDFATSGVLCMGLTKSATFVELSNCNVVISVVLLQVRRFMTASLRNAIWQFCKGTSPPPSIPSSAPHLPLH